MEAFQFEIRDLTKVYNGKKVLDIPRLSIKKGSIFGVMGPNGGGKTTFLSIISLLLPATSGKVYFEGTDTDDADQSSLRQKMTLILQNPLLFNTTVEKNIAYGLRLRGIDRKDREKRIEESLNLVGLNGFEKRRTREISGGEIQRVAIARAIALNPDALLLDEPTANIDQGSMNVLERILKDLNQRFGTTIILTSHDINYAYRLCDEVIHLFEGMMTRSPIENLFRGSITKEKDLFLFDTGRIKVTVLPERSESQFISIPPRDIIISLRPVSTSARNSFSGNITQMSDAGDAVTLEVDAGERVRVKVTKKSFQEMGLTIGSSVYLNFKSSSVEVF
jgi:molybdopterin-binding protein